MLHCLNLWVVSIVDLHAVAVGCLNSKRTLYSLPKTLKFDLTQVGKKQLDLFDAACRRAMWLNFAVSERDKRTSESVKERENRNPVQRLDNGSKRSGALLQIL